MKEKNNKGLIIGMIIFIIISLGLSGYIVYDKFFKKEVKTVQDKNEEKVSEAFVKNLYNEVNIDYNEEHYLYGQYGISEFYERNIKASDLNNELKMYLGYRQLKNSDIKKEDCLYNQKDDGMTICGNNMYSETKVDYKYPTNTISFDTLDKSIKSVFGNSVTYDKNTKVSIDGIVSYYEFESSNNKYYLYQHAEGGYANIPIFLYRHYNGYKIKNNEIIISQTYGKIAYANYNDICEDNQICFLTLDEEKTEKSINISDINNRDDAINYLNSSYDSIKDQLKEITYTFKKDQSGNYYFYESNLKSLN